MCCQISRQFVVFKKNSQLKKDLQELLVSFLFFLMYYSYHASLFCPSSSQWTCQFCTFVNTKPSTACEMCGLSCKDSAGASLPQSLQQVPSTARAQPPPPPGVKPQPKPRVNVEMNRQKRMRDDGLALIHQIRVKHLQQPHPEGIHHPFIMHPWKPVIWECLLY